ncbi:hypothetical protein BGZ52_005331 [Haplosporangium bisporale]|nr:hypothetical protein BGZ52_005331 [Haplosporangium bisporale]KAF9207507.1 hypothetical protein BGZ59_011114 [Podila verticillata]KAI9240425.1 MAG: hypothetical protein BYD32DRAFT_408429 [Podila humilis]KFH64571.1 hypothetical protein MVEG_09304 [Podila verticillata NRRL 6337]
MGKLSESIHDEVEVRVKDEKTRNTEENRPKRDSEDEDEDEDEDDGGDDVYEVERVAGHRPGGLNKNGSPVVSYLIKWKGYDESANTYEKEMDCDELIADYWDRYVAAGGKRTDPEGHEPRPQVVKRVANRKPSGNNRSSSHASEPLLPDLPPVSKESRESRESSASKRQRVSNESRKDSVATKRQRGDDAESEVEDDEEDKNKAWAPPAHWTMWDDFIREVQTVEKLKDAMVVHVLWKNGHETEHSASDAHEKFPQKLIHFYESHLKFTQA